MNQKWNSYPNVPDNPIKDEDSLPDYYFGQDLDGPDPDADYDNQRTYGDLYPETYEGSLVEDCACFAEQCKSYLALREEKQAMHLFEAARKAREQDELDWAMAQVMKQSDMMRARGKA